MELKEAKNTLEVNGYERKLVYKLTYKYKKLFKKVLTFQI